MFSLLAVLGNNCLITEIGKSFMAMLYVNDKDKEQTGIFKYAKN